MATAPTTIEQDIFAGQDFYVPAFKVKVRSKELLQVESDVLSVTYSDTDNRDEKKQQKKDSFVARDLVQDIAKQVRQAVPSLDLQVDDEEINRNLQNENEIRHLTVQRQYAINFLLDRSREIGYDLWLDLDENPTSSRRL